MSSEMAEHTEDARRGAVPPQSSAPAPAAPTSAAPTGPPSAGPASAGVHPPHDDPRHSASGGVAVGRVVEVTVDLVGDKEVEVRLADGRKGVIPRSEFEIAPSGGDVIRGALLAREDPRGRVWLSHTWARKLDGWDRVLAARAERRALEGPVTKSVKGGYVVDLGARAFLPVSQVPEEMVEGLVGSTVGVMVMEADRDKDRVIVSIRERMRRDSREQEAELFRSLEVGKRLDGVIRSIAEYGAVVDLGGVTGLIPRRELSWGRVVAVDDFVRPRDEVRVQVVDFKRQKRRITLSLRLTRPDPLSDLAEGDLVDGTVTTVVEYGAFMRIGDTELEGLVHVSELSEMPSYDARELVIPGERLSAKVVTIDRNKRRIGLSVRAAV